MTVHLLKSNFSRGELSPKVFSRIDLDLYEGGAEKVRNFYNVIHGGLRKRSGTRYTGECKSASTNINFIPFVVNSTGTAYVLEFGNNYIRFWTNGGQVTSGGSPVEVTTTYTSAQVPDLQYAQIGDTLFIAHPEHKPAQLVRTNATTWALTDVVFSDGPYQDINTTSNTVNWTTVPVLNASVTFTHATTDGINDGAGFQSTDVGRLYRVQTLGVWVWGVITSVTNTKVIVVTIKSDSVLANSAATSWTLFPGAGFIEAAGNTVQETGNVVHGLTSADLGKVFKAKNLTATDWYVRLTRIISDALLEFVMIGRDHAGLTNSATFRLGAFSATTGYPACVTFYQGRLVWAATTEDPRTVFFSQSNAPYSYSPSARDGQVNPDHGFSLSILAGRVDKLLWLTEAQKLLIGTPVGVRTIAKPDGTSVISPTDVSQTLEITYGADKCLPVQAGNAVVFAERLGRALRNVFYSFEENTLIAPNMTQLSDHLLKGGATQMAFQQVPDSILWTRTADGKLVGTTYARDDKVIGYHRHDFGGDSTVETLAVIPGTDRDELWLCVNRTIDGVSKKYVEILEAPFEDQDPEDAFFVDCGLTYSGSATGTVTGLAHLEGETVSILADGAVLPNVVVASGSVTLPNGVTASTIHVGLPITAEVKLLRPPFQQQDGVILARKQKAISAITEVIRSGGLRVGIEGRSTELLNFRKASDLVGQPTPLRDGPYSKTLNDSWEDGGQVYYYSDVPLPSYIRSVLVALDTEGTN